MEHGSPGAVARGRRVFPTGWVSIPASHGARPRLPDRTQHHGDLYGGQVEQTGGVRASGLRRPGPAPRPCRLVLLPRGHHLRQQVLLPLPPPGAAERYETQPRGDSTPGLGQGVVSASGPCRLFYAHCLAARPGRELSVDKHGVSAAAAESLQSWPTLCDPRDGSPPGSPGAGVVQARTLEWAAISFSSA